MTTLQELLDEHRRYHTDLQVDRMIIGKAGVTRFGQYRQALRELDSRTRAAQELILKTRELRIDGGRMHELLSEGSLDNRDAELLRINQDRNRLNVEGTEAMLRDVLREWLRFYRIACELKDELGPFDEAGRAAAEEEALYMQIAVSVACEMRCGGRLSPALYQSVLYLPPDRRDSLLAMLPNGTICQWVESELARIPVPNAGPITLEQIQAVREQIACLLPSSDPLKLPSIEA